jgi:uncharacterized phage protein gp47/JayE
MGFNKKNYRQIASDILTQICGGEHTETHYFRKNKNLYNLSNAPISEIIGVQGLMKGEKHSFSKKLDYRLTADAIEWLVDGTQPDDDTIFSTQYSFTRPSGISDVNVGSVVRTIVEAVSREIEFLYLQTEQAYLAGFIDTASGQALDLVVALLGVKRKPPQPSSGTVTFGRNTEPELVAVNEETHLYDGSLEYSLNKSLAKEIKKIKGNFREANVTFQQGVDYALSRNSIHWLPDGRKPDTKSVFHVDYLAYREIRIPEGTTVATFQKANEARFFRTLEEASLAPTVDGGWEAEIPIVSTVAGKFGNVLAGTIVVMPLAIPGVEFVINKGDMTNGVGEEEDTELKGRAKHALEFAGKATYVSLESAIRSVEGVNSIFIQDKPDGVAGLVRVIVDGGNLQEIKRITDDTRAAGIKVEICRPTIVYVNLSLTLLLHKEKQASTALTEAEKIVRSYISSLGIGENVLFSRIVESLVGLDGVWDVQDIRLTAQRSDGSVVESNIDNIEIDVDERAEPRTINIAYERKK